MSGDGVVQEQLWSETEHHWVFHVDMDAFFASVEQVDNPSLRGRPVVVANSPVPIERVMAIAQEARNGPPVEMLRGVRGVVAAASYEARAFGVRSAMPLARALVLCPDAVVVPGNFSRYSEVGRQLRRIWSEYSPMIEPMSIDEAYLDMTGCDSSGETVEQLARRMKEQIRRETSLTASVGAASNRLVAKIASDLRKPDGLVVVPRGLEAATIAPLPVRALPGVGPRTAEALASYGITRIGELAAASPEVLAARFGAEQGAALKRRAMGIDSSTVHQHGDPKSISNEHTLAEDTTDMAFLAGQITRIAQKVAKRARRDGFMAKCVHIKLRLLPARRRWTPEGSGFGRLITRRTTLPGPIDSAEEIGAQGLRLLDAAAAETGLASGREVVRLIGLGVSSLVRIEEVVIRLPDRTRRPAAVAPAAGPSALAQEVQSAAEPATPIAQSSTDNERARKLEAGLDRIRERFGENAIRRGAGKGAAGISTASASHPDDRA